MRKSNLNSRIKNLEKKLGANEYRPIIILDYDDRDERLALQAKQMGITVEELKERINNNKVHAIRVVYK